jgi:uncharacterized SAM-binding protein YcdF (DUF218 family)
LKRFRRFSLFSLAFLGALVLVVTATPLVSWWTGQLAKPWDDSRGDTLIVLSGSGGEGIIGYGTYLRCEYAVLAWNAGGFKRVVVTGGGIDIPQAITMKKFLVAEGLPETAILVEPRATSTRENALYTKDLLQGSGGKLVLLTSDYHTYRAMRVFRKVGLNVFTRPAPDAGKRATRFWNRWPVFLDLSTETVKIIYYRLKGWI